MTYDLSIATRASQFGDLVKKTVFTDSKGASVELESGVIQICDRLIALRDSGKKLYLIGNGGSAGVASHAATDFFNVAKLRATTLHEASMLTCMSNDFGYENAFALMLSQVVIEDDLVIAISSSGNSMNITNGAAEARRCGAGVVTLSGFSSENALRSLGDINIWLDSDDYGFVEIGHQFLLHNLSDRLNPVFS